MTTMRRFFHDISGSTALEYAIIGAGIAIVIVAGAQSIGTKVSNLYIGKAAAALS